MHITQSSAYAPYFRPGKTLNGIPYPTLRELTNY
jgi:hypothetical protein